MYNEKGMTSGEVMCQTFIVKKPRKDLVLPSCGDQVHLVLLSVCCFRVPLQL